MRRRRGTLLALTAGLTLAAGCGSEPTAGFPNDGPAAAFRNPLNNSGPDPWLTWYEDNYYLATTTWGGPSVGLTMRKAKRIGALGSSPSTRIWHDDDPARCCNYWAPEFFLLDGPNGRRWYGYFTGGATGDQYASTQFLHVIESAGTDPLGPYTYKGKLVERNAIDGSVLQLNGKRYAIYSVFNATQDVAIREMDSPWHTTGPEVVLTRPTLAWEREQGTVNEGPVALQHGGRTFIVYSASACWGPNYKLGLLTYRGGEPLSADSWVKSASPVFQRNDANGVFGPGHNNFFRSPDGTEDWIVYHANHSAGGGCDMNRTPRVQEFSWKADGTPDFGVPLPTSVELRVPAGEQ